MNTIANNCIEVLKAIAIDDSIEVWKKRNVFKSQIEILQNNQTEFANWVIAFIDHHESWLVKSEYSEELVNCFDSDFQECLDKLEKEQFLQLIEYATDKQKSAAHNNIPTSILLLEAVHFGLKEPTEEELKNQTFHRRQYNPKIKSVYEIHFPCTYQDVEERFERMKYCNCEGAEIQETHNFGGTISGQEKNGINRIITMDPIPKDLGITSVKKITIGFNFDKAFWIPINIDKPYYIKHNSEGEPEQELTNIPKEDIEHYKENPLRRCNVLLKKTPDKYIHHSDSKNEWRIGGMPNWWQEPENVCCINCKESMKFVIQLPSGDLKDTEGEGVYYGSDGGTTYGFWCDKDRIMAYIWQDT